MASHHLLTGLLLSIPLLAQTPEAAVPPPAQASTVPLAAGLTFADPGTIRAPLDFLRGPTLAAGDGLIHAVVEIPAGTSEKWEVGLDGTMRWDIKDGRPRVVAYLPYPANYGIVPRALLGRELEGDGDPLDVLVLGPAVPRGSVVAVRPVGVIRLRDAGERDDKILAVPVAGPLADVTDLVQLERSYPGVTRILQTWFENYKGAGRLQCQGFAGAADAAALVEAAARSFTAAEAAAGKAR